MFGSDGTRVRYLLSPIWRLSWENGSIVADWDSGAGSRRRFSLSEAIIGREGLVWLVDMVLLLKSKWVMAVWCWWKVDADVRLPILMILVLYSSHCCHQYHWYWYRQYHWYQSWQCGWRQWLTTPPILLLLIHLVMVQQVRYTSTMALKGWVWMFYSSKLGGGTKIYQAA